MNYPWKTDHRSAGHYHKNPHEGSRHRFAGYCVELKRDIIGIDLPCCTSSAARGAARTSSMPHRLRQRDPHKTFGLAAFSGKDRWLADQGNRQVRFAVKVIKQVLHQKKTGYLENPLTSCVWYLLERLLRKEISQGLIRFV